MISSAGAPGTQKGALGEAYQPPPPPPSDQTSLNVALYPYVPSLNSFTSAVQTVWARVRPDISLNFVFYDPYTGPPPDTVDVFAFDCIYVDDFNTGGVVDPIAAAEINALADVMPFARVNAALDANQTSFAGIPYLGCASVLYFRRGDPQLDNQNPLGIQDLYEILGDARYPGPVPPPGVGLLMDLGGKTTDACLYAALWRTLYSTWWPQPLPMGNQLDAGVLEELRAYATMAGRAQALFEDPGYDRTEWFASGDGRALVGLTETMAAWSPAMLANVGFRPLPSAPSGNAANVLFYADAVGIRPNLGPQRSTALQLANVIASQQVVQAALAPTGISAQYLIPARQSVLSALAGQLPQYVAIAKMIAACSPVSYRLGPGVSQWTAPTGLSIIIALFPVSAEAPAVPEKAAERPRRHGFEQTPAGLWRRER